MAKQSDPTRPKPERKFRIGLLTATVWLNEGDKRSFRTVDLQRSFRNGDGWDSNSTFTLNDLPQTIEVLRLAMNYVADEEADITES